MHLLTLYKPRGVFSRQTEKFPRKTRSQVMISNVRDTDSGEYSCSPSDLPPSVITVHVQHGRWAGDGIRILKGCQE